MLKINYKGYEISQAENNHIMICKDNKMLFHVEKSTKANKEELKNILENYLNLVKILEEVETDSNIDTVDLLKKVDSGEQMKIDIYTLLGLIKDGKAPNHIRYNNEDWYWGYDTYVPEEYLEDTPDVQIYASLFRRYRLDYCLNKKVDIIGEIE